MSSSNRMESVGFGAINDGKLTYYTCPMDSHSYVRRSAPGKCPECGMTLMEKTVAYDSQQIYYSCPMPEHAHVVLENPGNCRYVG